METLNFVCRLILQIFSVLSAYKIVLAVIGFFVKEKPLPPPVPFSQKYGVVICARNEERVIANLIASIRAQTYDGDKLTVFVCADNCSDRTAEICRELGCVVYERHDPSRARKGYALQFLFENIARDYGIRSFDGYFFFDADNLLKKDFVECMNRMFTPESGVIVGYRNTKNFDTNIISAAYGLHFYESTMKYHRARHCLGLSTHIAGTGYLVNSRLLEGGWPYTCLTEDAQFTVHVVAKGEKIEFCEQAEFFDEQPHNFFVGWRQRMRWTKGRIFAFFTGVCGLVAGIFRRKGAARKISCYDIFFYEFPYALFSLILGGLYPVLTALLSIFHGTFWANLNLPSLIPVALGAAALYYLKQVALGALVCFRERRHIRCPKGKLVLYVLTWVWFSAVSMPILVVSLFQRIKWKPIVHDDAKTIEEIDAQKTVTESADAARGRDTEEA